MMTIFYPPFSFSIQISVIMLRVIKMCVSFLSVIMLNAIMLNVAFLKVIAPHIYLPSPFIPAAPRLLGLLVNTGGNMIGAIGERGRIGGLK